MRQSPLVPAVLAAALALHACGGSKTTGAPQPAATVTLVTVAGGEAPLRIGDIAQFSAIASFSDGTTKTVTSASIWFSSNPVVAAVSGTGVVTALAAGDADVRASYGAQAGSQGISVLTASASLSCGVERWAVKTLSDSAASQIDLGRVQSVSIRDLNLMPAHCSGIPDSRTFGAEFQVFETTGRIIVVRSEDDRDYHVALADPADAAYTIVVEVPDPDCNVAAQSSLRAFLVEARRSLDAIVAGRSLSSLMGQTLRVRGVGFYDFNHGQTGRSQSCLELHPLTAVDRVQ